MKTRKRTLLVPLLIAASAPLISAAATGDPAAPKPEDQAAAKADDKSKDNSQLQTVTITAEHTSSSLQRTADSVSVRTGADMEAKGRFSLAQMLEDVAGVTGGAAITANGAVASSGTDSPAAGLTIRGIVSNSGAGGSVTSVAPAAAIYVDGVYGGMGSSFDVDRVEVLRGPQGTLYGRSATSGLVAIHTVDPELGEFEANALAELGSYDLRHYTAALNVPLGEHLAMRFAANHIERNGYFDKQGGEFSTNDARLKLLYKPNADISLLAGYSVENNITHNGGTSISLSSVDQSYDSEPIMCSLTERCPVGSGKNDFRQYWAQLDVNLGLATLTWLPAIRTWQSAGTGYIDAKGQFTLRQTIAAPLDRFNTQEVRLASAKGSKIQWQLGALYYKNTLANSNQVYLLPPVDAVAFTSITKKKVTDADGAYGQVTYPFSDTTRVTAGARYDTTKVAVDQDYTSITGQTQSLSGPDGVRKFKNTTWKLRAEHDLDASKMLYASVSTGFSPGDITVTTNSAGNPVVLTLDAETLTAWEIGSKNRFLDNRLQVNGAVFYYDYTGFQTANVNITPELPTPGYATLAAPAYMWGGEVEVQWKLTSSDMLSADVSYTNARYRERNSTLIPTGTGTDVTFGDFFAKDQIPGVVPVRINASYTHGFHFANGSSLSVTGSARFMSGYDAAPLTKGQAAQAKLSADARVNSKVVGDFNVNWQSPAGMYTVGGYVRNITDNRYKTFVTVNDTGTNATPYDPRTFGVIMRVAY
jgi:iron complex outermembrane receptor protein